MKKSFKVLILVGAILIAAVATSCATSSFIGGAGGPHGFFTGNGNAATVANGGQEIASYSVILGLFDSGYPSYAEAVMKACAEGKVVTCVNTNYFGFMDKVTAYARSGSSSSSSSVMSE